ncbi:MAG: hypothetical protein Q3965_00795 [Rothia sp. (in: high G+C Gram-positive bacteria)]|nr:hypothetical protein [Rothia sp. (in: high G+C Gram-positive bacteria)]
MWSIEEASLKLARLRELPYGTARTAAAEFTARTIENEGPEQKLPEALLTLVEAYVFGTPNPASFATFSKLLRLWDAHPEHFSEYDSRTLFWQFKWITGDLAAWPQISRQQARGLLDEMRKRYALAGFSAAAVDRAEYMWAGHLGLDEEAERWRAAWLAHGEDEMDCESCKIGGELRDHIVAGEFQQAVDLGAPTTDFCNREPANSHRQLALAYLELGDGVAAGQHLARAQAARDQYDPDDLGLEFEVLARGGQLAEALDLLVRQGQRALRLTDDPGSNRSFLRYLIAGLAWAVEEHGQLETGLAQGATLAELYRWALDESAPLAAAFDARAGNSRFTEALEAAQEEPRLTDLVLVSAVNFGGSAAAGESGGLDAAAGVNETDAARPTGGFTVDGKPWPPTPSADESDPAATAEGFLAGGDLVQAAYWYERAGATEEAAGRSVQAGCFFAEAARALAGLRQRDRALELFERAWPLLVSGGSAARLLLAVARAWGEVAETAGNVQGLATALDTAGQVAERELTAAQAAGAQPWVQKNASMLVLSAGDLAARAFAALGQWQDAARLAAEVAEVYEKAGEGARAGSSWLLAGQAAWEAKDAAAASRALEAAVAAFGAADRRESKAAALNLLIEVLNETGQTHRVEELLGGLL